MNRRDSWSFLQACLLAATLWYVQPATAHDEHEPHFDAPQHGGVVMEFNEMIHYEIVVLPTGSLQIWFSDIHRRPMAASEVTDVAAEVDHANNSADPVDMHISADGGCWVGKLRVPAPSDVVRVGFVYRQEPATGSVTYSSYLAAPRKAPQAQPAKAGKHR